MDENLVFFWCIKILKRKGEDQMKDEETLKDLSGEILVDMDNWNKPNQNATFLKIEEKAWELVSKLEVALIKKKCIGARNR